MHLEFSPGISGCRGLGKSKHENSTITRKILALSATCAFSIVGCGPTWQWAFIEKTSRFQRTNESDMAPKPRGSGGSNVKTKSQPSKLFHWTPQMSAEARVTQSHGHGTSKVCGPTNSCRSRNYFLSFGLIVTFARCGSFMTCTGPTIKIFTKFMNLSNSI
ncbi:hypothetical protein VNO78_19350 [Psophocarpus tetragonolobus]|uniref:Uncharacterized protein n=1 Tax=Psophocarpus tetragonolobus TaxID=3891 RepID=A0AAN9XG67_PSOTE